MRNINTRQEKVNWLKDLLAGKKTIADLRQSSTLIIKLWHTNEHGDWQDEEGNTITKEQMQRDEYPPASRNKNLMNMLIVNPIDED